MKNAATNRTAAHFAAEPARAASLVLAARAAFAAVAVALVAVGAAMFAGRASLGLPGSMPAVAFAVSAAAAMFVAASGSDADADDLAAMLEEE